MNSQEHETITKKMKLAIETKEVTAVASTTCQHWVYRKKRNCKMTVSLGKIYCGEHSVAQSDTDDKRIPCPLDPKHSVEKYRLVRHLKVCNAKKPENLPAYIKVGCNSGEPNEEEEIFRLHDIPQNDLDEIIQKVESLFAEHIAGSIETNVMEHENLAAELSNETYGSEKRKHLLQTSSILGIMKHENFLQPRTCFIEFGAGKAELTYWLANAIRDHEGAKVLVVDKASHRHKKDNLIRDRNLVERIRADIADLDLKELDTKCDSLVGISKHLCGAATDLALRCMVQGNEHAIKTRNFIICLCCHHRCTFSTFVGQEWLLANGIDKKTFNILIKIVSWFTCGDGLSRDKKDNAEKESERKVKEEIGWKSKRLLDFARLQYLKANNYDARLCFYADKDVTLENVCIIGKYSN